MAPTTASGAIAMPDVDFLKGMYQAGLKGNYDLLGVHGAGYKAPPETSPDDIAKNAAVQPRRRRGRAASTASATSRTCAR